MPVDPEMLRQVLQAPEDRAAGSPIVTAVILRDPSNAADLVPYLEQPNRREARNARRILCLFPSAAAHNLVRALQLAGPHARKNGLEALWAVLSDEIPGTLRAALQPLAGELRELLADRTLLPDTMPAYTERDFRGRICDLAYLIVRSLLEPEFDQTEYRALEDDERDREITRLLRRFSSPDVA